MATAAIGSSSVNGSQGPTAGFAGRISGDQFLKLLLTQIKNQNPLEPLKDAEFAAQLAQFSTLESLQQLNSSFGDLLLLQSLTQGANLLGKTISFQLSDANVLFQGVVDAVNVRGGRLELLVGGQSVALDQVRGVVQPSGGARE